MKKRYLVFIMGILMILSACGKSEKPQKTIEKNNEVFQDDFGKYTLKKVDKTTYDGKISILLDYENITDENQIPWESSGFKIEQENGTNIYTLERVKEFSEEISNKEDFENAFEEVAPGKKTEIELIYNLKYKEGKVYIRGVLDNNETIQIEI